MDEEKPLEHFLDIRTSEVYGSNSRKTLGETVNFALKNVDDAIRPDRLLERVFEKLIHRVVGNRKPKFIGVQLLNERMDNSKPYHVPMRPPHQNTPSAIAQAFEQLAQSDADLNLYGGQIQCKIFAVWLPGGNCALEKCRKKRRGLRSLVQVVNPQDTWCMARSVAIGMAYYRLWKKPEEFKIFCDEGNVEQEKRAKRLLVGAGLSKKKHLYDLMDVNAIQKFLDKTYGKTTYRLVVFSREHHNTIIWKKQMISRHPIYLYLENGHFSFFSKPGQLMNVNDFCLECERPVLTGQYHLGSCPAACQRCLRYGFGYPCKRKEGKHSLKCEKCGFIFETPDCYNYHLTLHGKQAKTICQKRYLCKKCSFVVVARAGQHRCIQRDTDGKLMINTVCKDCNTLHSANQLSQSTKRR